MASSARQKVVAEFSLPTMTSTYEKLYDELIADAARRA
jgi:hypothetical protein